MAKKKVRRPVYGRKTKECKASFRARVVPHSYDGCEWVYELLGSEKTFQHLGIPVHLLVPDLRDGEVFEVAIKRGKKPVELCTTIIVKGGK